MSSPVVDIDPDGEVIIVIPSLVPANEKAARKTTSTVLTDGNVIDRGEQYTGRHKIVHHGSSVNFKSADDEAEKQPVRRWRVSKKHLMVASARAKKMYQLDFKESRPDSNGLCHWKLEPIFDQTAFEIVLNIIHGQTNKAPHTVTLDTLAEVAAITDDLQCHNAVKFVTDAWLERLQSDLPTEICPDLYKWILIASVFGQADRFRSTTRVAIMQCTGSLSPGSIPVHPSIIDSILSTRRALFIELVGRTEAVLQCLRLGISCCTFECRSMLLGALMQEMDRAGLSLSDLLNLVPKVSLSAALHSMRNFYSPAVYTERSEVGHVQDGYMNRKSNILWRQERSFIEDQYGYNNSKKKFHSSPFLNPQDFLEPKGAYDDSKTLFRHECSLKRLLKPILSAIEAKITGLDIIQSVNCRT